MTDETEVVESTHRADGDTILDISSSRSPLYSETDVSGSNRKVTFWNRANYSDTTMPKKRKIIFRIVIIGHGISKIGQAEQEYYSPLGTVEHLPIAEVTVPDHGLPQYSFQVRTNYELFNWNGSSWDRATGGETPPETAIVNDNSSGG